MEELIYFTGYGWDNDLFHFLDFMTPFKVVPNFFVLSEFFVLSKFLDYEPGFCFIEIFWDWQRSKITNKSPKK